MDAIPDGTLVEIINSGYKRAKVAKFRGPLGPGGARIYRVPVQRKPRPVYIEVRQDQLRLLDEQSRGAWLVASRAHDAGAPAWTSSTWPDRKITRQKNSLHFFCLVIFLSGSPVFAGTTISAETHIQIAVRNLDCILGVFRPNL